MSLWLRLRRWVWRSINRWTTAPWGEAGWPCETDYPPNLRDPRWGPYR